MIDGLAYVGESIFGDSVDPSELLAHLDASGIDRAVVCPLKPRGYHLGPANDAVADAVRSHPERLAGLGRVDPLLGDDACREADRALGELGLAGLFLHPWEETFRIHDACVERVVEVAAEHGAPVVVAAGYPVVSEAPQVAELAGRFPGVSFVATNGLQLNMSGLGQRDAELALEANPNLSIHTTGVYREDFLVRVVETYGPERLLFASASPRFDLRFELERARTPAFPAGAAEAVLHGNAARLFGAG